MNPPSLDESLISANASLCNPTANAGQKRPVKNCPPNTREVIGFNQIATQGSPRIQWNPSMNSSSPASSNASKLTTQLNMGSSMRRNNPQIPGNSNVSLAPGQFSINNPQATHTAIPIAHSFQETFPSTDEKRVESQASEIFGKNLVVNVVQKTFAETGKRFHTVEEMCDAILKFEESKVKPIENNFLQETHTAIQITHSSQKNRPSGDENPVESQASEVFGKNLVRNVVQKTFAETGKRFHTVEEICDAILKLEEKKAKPLEQNPNKDIPEELLCKICLDQRLSIVFHPCGHLATCQECSQSLTKCPMCRSLVKRKKRIYM